MNLQKAFILIILILAGNACLSRFTNRLKEKIEQRRFDEEEYKGSTFGSDTELKFLFLNLSKVSLELNHNRDWQFRLRFKATPEKIFCISILRSEIEARELDTKKEHYIRYDESGGKYPNVVILDWEKRRDIDNLLRINNDRLHPCVEEGFKEKLNFEMFPTMKGFFPNVLSEVILPTSANNSFHLLGRHIPQYAASNRTEDAVPSVFTYIWNEDTQVYSIKDSQIKFTFPYQGNTDPKKLNTSYTERTNGKKEKLHFYLVLEDEIKTYYFYVREKNDSLYAAKIIPPLIVLEDFDRMFVPPPPPRRKNAKLFYLFLPFTILADTITYPFQILDCFSEYNWTRPAKKECQ